MHAAFASAGTFAVGEALRLLVIVIAPKAYLIAAVARMSLLFLAVLVGLAALAGGANRLQRLFVGQRTWRWVAGARRTPQIQNRS